MSISELKISVALLGLLLPFSAAFAQDAVLTEVADTTAPAKYITLEQALQIALNEKV